MSLLRSLPPLLLALGLLLASGPRSGHAQQEDTTESTTLPELTPPEQESDVPYVPTPEPVVDRMLELANVDETDIVYDLGSGDGRIVIRAARTYGARGVGIEIDPARVEEARKNAQKAGVSDLVEFRQGDLFASKISDATVVTLYLLPSVNQKLRPILFEQLSPGTPVVSHDFDMGQWSPDRTVDLKGDTVYRWTIPEEIPEDLQDR
ncbi:SAM-dependent methyltransferase [Salinibacter altiplanensis]|uniref:SAM-dependent methyltransferase n=1 Tax=Salinibacter altiplanensis TaxID=1803181 RepID=UPI000C9FE3CE|nr:methyltransferase domain-containing protein [Salinibacter altiplanensis]